MKAPTLYEDLQFRHLIYQISDSKLISLMNKGLVCLYGGFDPSAPSLGVGNLVILTLIARFLKAGNSGVIVIGGATGLIGDPGGKTQERQLIEREKVFENATRIEAQIKKFFDNLGLKIEVVNNLTWLNDLKLLDFLRDVGKLVTVNQMIARESVKQRINREETGISYAEFSYMLLQAYDYLYLNKNFGVNCQCGASEQWGNIVQGIELIRKATGVEVYGLTTPLFLKADGSKFGKTESGNVWLDSSLTTAFDFYQFWYNLPDSQVADAMKVFSFFSQEEILNFEESLRKEPQKRIAHKALAMAMTELVHGKQVALDVAEGSNKVFSYNVFDLSLADFSGLTRDIPHASMDRNLLDKGLKLVNLVKEVGLCHSLSEARRLIVQKGLYLNNLAVDDLDRIIETSDLIHGRWVLLRVGRNKQFIVEFS